MKKVLVVENSPTIISVADSLLRQRGYDVTCLSDGAKALQFALAEKPDLILTAIGLRGIDGIQLCKKISSEASTGGIPVVLLIGDKDSVYEDKIDLCGARGRIKKPFSPKELVAIVDKYTGGLKQKAPKVIDQGAQDGPRLEPRVSPQEIGSSTQNITVDKKKQPDKKHDTVFNLDWQDLKNDPDFESEREGAQGLDDSGLELEDDQYGLTKLPEEVVPLPKKDEDEDYDWFIGEMKKEIEGPVEGQQAAAASPDAKSAAQPKEEQPDVSYDNIGNAGSKDDTKYRQFLEQFKKDTSVMTEEKSSPSSNAVDVNWLVDRIADRIAQKIVEKIDKNELRQIISSMLGNMK